MLAWLSWLVPALVNAALCYFFYKRGFSRGWDACADALPDILPAIARLTSEKKSDPYRAPVKLPVVQEEPKVYCKNCKHIDYEYPSWKNDPLFKYGTPFCWFGDWVDHPVRGKHRERRSVKHNENFDCKDYEARK